MVRNFEQLKGMTETVARALGEKLLGEVAFAGGVITGLLVADEVTKEDIRITSDSDFCSVREDSCLLRTPRQRRN